MNTYTAKQNENNTTWTVRFNQSRGSTPLATYATEAEARACIDRLTRKWWLGLGAR